MRERDGWRERLQRSRSTLLDAVRELSPEALVRRPPGEVTPEDERWPVRDVLWHVSEHEDRWQRWVRATLDGRPAERFVRRPRPARLSSLPLLLERLQETRAATHVLLDELASLDAQERARPRPGPRGREISLDGVIALLESHDRDHAQQVREILRVG